jgi:phage-related protein
MISLAAITLVLLAGLSLPPAFAQAPPRVNKAPKAQRPANPPNRQAEQLLQKLARMSPEERQKALASLPPERRQMMMRRLRNFEAMPPAARERATSELERLHSLPPQRQNQIRRSLRELQTLPEDRKALVVAEIQRLNGMPEDDRRSRMNSEEFRNRYSPAEQQMMGDLSEVLP